MQIKTELSSVEERRAKAETECKNDNARKEGSNNSKYQKHRIFLSPTFVNNPEGPNEYNKRRHRYNPSPESV